MRKLEGIVIKIFCNNVLPFIKEINDIKNPMAGKLYFIAILKALNTLFVSFNKLFISDELFKPYINKYNNK